MINIIFGGKLNIYYHERYKLSSAIKIIFKVTTTKKTSGTEG